jgi:hypothetical protein
MRRRFSSGRRAARRSSNEGGGRRSCRHVFFLPITVARSLVCPPPASFQSSNSSVYQVTSGTSFTSLRPDAREEKNKTRDWAASAAGGGGPRALALAASSKKKRNQGGQRNKQTNRKSAMRAKKQETNP